ncbi:MAG: hypothetical protein WAW92_03905 [Minisyncoccia bacterium]
MEEFKVPERISEDVLVDIINTKGIEHVDTIEEVRKYYEQCENEANILAVADYESRVASNRANIGAQISMGRLFAKTKYRNEAFGYFEDARVAASQDEHTKDLATIAEREIAALG